jgi:hypothetical protein
MSVGCDDTHQTAEVEKSGSLKNFFQRIGSTGFLHSPVDFDDDRCRAHSTMKKSSSKSTAVATATAEKPMYRSLSTSQLVMSSYIRGDDPADYIGDDDEKEDTSCSYEENLHIIPRSGALRGVASGVSSSYIPTKTVSCDNIVAMESKCESTLTPANRKSSFPYAFLRSKLSVLPEENGGSVLKSFNHHRSSILQSDRYSTSPNFCCKFEYKRSSSYVCSSNESGYDSDSARVSEKSDAHNASSASDGDNTSLVAQSSSDNNDNDSDFVESVADFELDQMDTCKLMLDVHHQNHRHHQPHHGDPTNDFHGSEQHSKVLNTPSMNLFYKKNEFLKNRPEETNPGKPKFTRHMFIKNSTRRELCKYARNNLSKSYEQDLSSLPETVNENELHCRYKLIRLIKNSVDEDLGVYLKMKIHHMASRIAYDSECREARYVVVKLEPGKIADRYIPNMLHIF